MASTATFGINPNLATYVDEACERAGLDLQEITGQHIISIRRSMGFVFSKWTSLGHRQWKFNQTTRTPAAIGENVFDLPVGTVEVQSVVLRRNGVDTEMYSISRSDYLVLHDKDLTGRPDRYFVDRRRDDEAGINNVQMFYWLSAENVTDQIIVDLWQQPEDPGIATNTPDIPFRFQDCFAADLAVRVAQKYKPDRMGDLKAEAKQAWTEAHDEDRDSAPLIISANYSRQHGRP